MIHDGSYVCSRCLADEYLLCAECDEYFLADEVSLAVEQNSSNSFSSMGKLWLSWSHIWTQFTKNPFAIFTSQLTIISL